VAHACNPSYSGGGDQEDQGSVPAPGEWFVGPNLGKTSQERAGGVAQGEGPEFKPRYWTKEDLCLYRQTIDLGTS
jgi:hypothetical protein